MGPAAVSLAFPLVAQARVPQKASEARLLGATRESANFTQGQMAAELLLDAGLSLVGAFC
jgi:hypothetical protein